MKFPKMWLSYAEINNKKLRLVNSELVLYTRRTTDQTREQSAVTVE